MPDKTVKVSDVSVVVLAGGRSSRMKGEDKATKPFKGKPMLHWVMQALRDLAGEFIVVVRDADQAKEVEPVLVEWPGSTIMIDDVRGFGPTAGMAAGFAAAGSEYCFLVACDMPCINPEVVRLIVERCKGADAAVPRWANGQMEPLFTCYRRKPALKAANRALDNGFRRVMVPMYGLSDIEWVSIEGEIRPLDGGLLSLTNINTPEEWDDENKSIAAGNPGNEKPGVE